MARGLGRVFRRNGSSFLWIGYYAHGKEQREVARHVRTGEKLEIAGKNSNREAERFLRHRLGEIAAEQHGGRSFIGPQQERVTVTQLLDGLETDYKIRDKWNAKIESVTKPLRNRFGTWRAVALTSEVIGTYIEALRAEGYTNATVNRRTQILRQAFNIAIRNKQLSQQPFIPRLSEIGNERDGFFETADFEAVCLKLPEYLRDFCRFGFLTGWRKGSIESLRWSDVAEDVIYLRAENSKTRKAETMPLQGELRDIIERCRASAVIQDPDREPRFAEYVFHVKGRRIGDFRKTWATACVAAGLGKMICPKCGKDGAERICAACKGATRYSGRIFHDFRRTASRNMIAAGVPQAVAMKITGHRTDSMFRRYAIVNEEQKREALARTQQYLAAKPAERKVAVMGKAT
jgi:integrase